MAQQRIPNVLMVGTGEYTTGYVEGKSSNSDKRVGVIGLSFFYLRSIKKVARVLMAGTNGTKFPGVREHFAQNISSKFVDIRDVSFESFPKDDVKRDPEAYLKAMDTLVPGDLVVIFTPDDTHYDIAKAAITRGLHILVTKPAVKTLKEQQELAQLAREKNVLVAIEFHKRWDNTYNDARAQMRSFGDFSYYYSYMTQPKFQLETFKNWNWGKNASSDISYYLNSHHVDILNWAVNDFARPVRVVANASSGLAKNEMKIDTDDTITLMVQWENIKTKTIGTSVHTSSWISPVSDVHSQQRFHYMGHHGEITIDQAHRNYTVAADAGGFKSPNPFFFRYSPDANGRFAAMHSYGYLSIQAFVDAAATFDGKATGPEDVQLATLKSTMGVTAILEAGRRSLDQQGKAILIHYKDGNSVVPEDLVSEK